MTECKNGIEKAGGGWYIDITCEDDMAQWEQSVGQILSDEHQQDIFPGDTFFRYIANTDDIFWGGKRIFGNSSTRRDRK